MDAPRLDAWSIHCLTVFVRERHVTRAGAALGLSQPAASSLLAKLRATFGDPLLVKSPSGMVPTLRALDLARQCERMLHINLCNGPRDVRGQTRTPRCSGTGVTERVAARGRRERRPQP